MRIAVMADIHSNHIALERCIEKAKELRAEKYIFLGDYIGELSCPEVTIDLLDALKKEYPCTFIRGNKENYWIDHKKGLHSDWRWEKGTSGSGMLLYSYEHLTEKQIEAFEQMPISQKIQYPDLPPFVICHGSPFKVNQDLREDCDYIDEVTARLETELTICGHTHMQGEFERNGRRVINPGSVGVPLKSDGKTQFMILYDESGEWKAEYLSLSYDVDRAIQEMDAEQLYEQAPGWYKVTKAVLKGKETSHARVLSKAYEFCQKYEGKVDWRCIPEKYWQMALDSLEIN